MTAREAASISSRGSEKHVVYKRVSPLEAIAFLASGDTADPILQSLQARADLLRSTAMELRAGKINAFHAANRIDRIARELAKERK